VPQGLRGGARLVSGTRTWRWSPSDETGWPARDWLHERVETPQASWFARLAVSRPTVCPPLVFVHGVVVSGAYFQPVARLLTDDFHTYVPDIPGTGRSHVRDGSWSIAEQARGLAEWIDLHALGPSVLVGNSLGAQVLTMLAVDRPDLVASLVLVAPTTDPDAGTVFRMMQRGVRDIPRERLGLWKIWIPDLVRTGPVRGIRHLRQGLADDQRERLDTLGVPVVVVGGEHDPIAVTGWIEAMAGALPQGRQVIVPGASHAMNYTNPRHLARIIRAVAARSPAGG